MKTKGFNVYVYIFKLWPLGIKRFFDFQRKMYVQVFVEAPEK